MSDPNKDRIRARIAELTEKRKREEEARKANRKSGSPKRNPPKREEPRAERVEQPSRNNHAFSTDDSDSSDDITTIMPKPRAHLNFHGNIPPPPTIDTTGWSIGSETRRLHQHPDKSLTGEVKIKQSNLDHMERMTNRQFDDAKHYRETVERVQLESQKQMYEDMNKQRKSAERMQREQELRKWKEHEQERINQTRAASLAQRREYLDKERERNAQFRSQLLTEHAEFKKREQESKQRLDEQRLAWKRERSQQKAELERQREALRQRELEHEREIEEYRRREEERRAEQRRQQEYEREMRERQNMQEQYMAQMEYGDRAQNRTHQRDMEFGVMQLNNADRNNERKYNLARARLDRISELADVYDRVQNGIQQRHFNAMAFHDSRVGNHRNYVKLEKEQRGINREAEVRDIFDAFDMGDPDMLDLTERRISHPIRLLRRSGCHSYLHTYLITGVESVIQNPDKDPYILFMDGSRKTIPSWSDGYAIQPRSIRPHVWIMDVYKVPLDMADKPRRCCEICSKLCNVQ